MTAKGKINASKVQAGDRIIVKTRSNGTVYESATKTGEFVSVARVIAKTFRAASGQYERRGKYVIETNVGTFEAAAIQTMWLAPEDAAGIKRAYAEDAEHERAAAAEREMDAVHAEALDEDRQWFALSIMTPAGLALVVSDPRTDPRDRAFALAEIAKREELTLDSQACKVDSMNNESATAAPIRATIKGHRDAGLDITGEVMFYGCDSTGPRAEGKLVTMRMVAGSGSYLTGTDGKEWWAGGVATKMWLGPVPAAEPVELVEETATEATTWLGDAQAETVHQATVTADQDDAPTTWLADVDAPAREATGSAVVKLLEKVWARIRENHPELPQIVMITGSGLVGSSKWGHFRPNGWKVRAEGAATSETMHEMFMAGETLAKGARQVLQTMLHEGAHTLARVRDVQDTSRQGRWHNAQFRKLAEEMGLEHKHLQADNSHGFSFVTLTQSTITAYADLLAELDREIHLTCNLPGWLGGEQDEEGNGGEKITKPKTGETKSSGNVKATCLCAEPLIIRLSQRVLDLGVVKCDECDEMFMAASR